MQWKKDIKLIQMPQLKTYLSNGGNLPQGYLLLTDLVGGCGGG
jgi:hypothetical protein